MTNRDDAYMEQRVREFAEYQARTTFVGGYDNAMKFMDENLVFLEHGSESKAAVIAQNVEDFMRFIQRVNIVEGEECDLTPFREYVSISAGDNDLEPDMIDSFSLTIGEDIFGDERPVFLPSVITQGYLFDFNPYMGDEESKAEGMAEFAFQKAEVRLYERSQLTLIKEITFPALLTFYSIDSFDRSGDVRGAVFEVFELSKIPTSNYIVL